MKWRNTSKWLKVAAVIIVLVAVFIFVDVYYDDDSRVDSIVDNDVNSSQEESHKAENLITLEEAKQIALNDAHYSESDVVFTKAELYDGLRKIYDIEFKADEKEWDYEINAKNGQIMAFDNKLDDQHAE